MILQKQSGQSLIEILVAIGVGVIMLVGAVTALTPAIKSLSDVSKTQGAAAISKELLDNLRIFVEANWHNIDTLSTSTKYFLNTATSTFAVATGTEAIIADGIKSGLVGYWKFDDNTVTSTMDFSGNENHGAKVGTPMATSSCPIGGCFKFNGTTDGISISKTIDLSANSFTISNWVNTTSSVSQMYTVSNAGSGNGYRFGLSGGYIHFLIGDGAYTSMPCGGPNVNDGRWHMITGVFNRGTVNSFDCYLDGAKTGSVALPSNYPAMQVVVKPGIAKPPCCAPFVGYIDDVRIYNRDLTAAEINTIYRANIFTRNFQVSDVYRDGNDEDKIIEGTSGALDPSTKKVTIEYGWSGAQLKTFSAYFTRYKNRSFVQYGWQGGVGTAYTTTTANWFTTSSNINYSTSTGLRIFGL